MLYTQDKVEEILEDGIADAPDMIEELSRHLNEISTAVSEGDADTVRTLCEEWVGQPI